MKKFTKICIFIATGLMSVGILLLIITCIMGAPKQFISNAKEGTYNLGKIVFDKSIQKGIDATQTNSWNTSYEFSTDSFDDEFPIYSGNNENLSLVKESDLNTIDVSFGCGILTIKESSSDEIGFESKCSDDVTFQCYTENNTLIVKGFRDKKDFELNHKTNNELILYIPSTNEIESMTFDIGAAEVKAEQLSSTEDIRFDVGAGSVSCNQLTTNTFSADIGAGSLSVKNGTVEDASIEIGVGEGDFAGSIQGDLSADCSMGDLTMTLQGSQKDYNYDLSCSMGELSVGQMKYSGISYDDYVDNEADATYTISCGMGDVSIQFND